MRQIKTVTFTLLTLFNIVLVSPAQTAATATVSGTVSDSQGAIVPGAVVRLVDTATNQERRSTADDAGQYQFLAVQPGLYDIIVSMPGFRQGYRRDVKVDVSKAYEFNFDLEVGSVTEKVEVGVSAGTELQKLDATVGSVIGGAALKLLPSLSRDAAALLSLQPMVYPPGGGRGGGFSRRNIDVSIGKETRVTDRIRTRFSADFTNVFNWVEYADPSLNLTDPAGFGDLTSQQNRPRFIQLGLRVEW